MMLISPWEANVNGFLVANNQRIRWPQAGKLDTAVGWNSTSNGAGAMDLLDTGGHNVWGALLGTRWIQYQNNSIWSLTHVGGSRTYEPDIEIPDLGLLAPHLLFSRKNIHYFVGHDYNVYAFSGGGEALNISRKIDRYLRRDLDPAYVNTCWLSMGADGSRLWLFIVPKGKQNVTEAYGIDVNTGAWMKRDFTNKWPTGGITSVGLVGAGSYATGMTFQEAVDAGYTSETFAVGGGTPNVDELEGKTFAQMTETILTEERIVLGDSDGYVYQYDSDLTTDDGKFILSTHITEIFDAGKPSKNKIWPSLKVTAKGVGILVYARTDNFESTATSSWTLIGWAILTDEFVDYEFFINDTSKKIQFKFASDDGEAFQISNYEVTQPALEDAV
jgi:hypothetical protein